MNMAWEAPDVIWSALWWNLSPNYFSFVFFPFDIKIFETFVEYERLDYCWSYRHNIEYNFPLDLSCRNTVCIFPILALNAFACIWGALLLFLWAPSALKYFPLHNLVTIKWKERSVELGIATVVRSNGNVSAWEFFKFHRRIVIQDLFENLFMLQSIIQIRHLVEFPGK